MTRITEALRRARNDSSGGSEHDDSRARDTIQFFAPGQPAVDSPWDIPEEPAGDPPDASLDLVDERLRSDSRSVRLDAGVGATVPLPARTWSEKLTLSPSLSPVIRAQYSKLAAALHDTHRERDIKVVMVISTGSGEGKTLTAANLALTFSEVF